ncbi:gluconokinase [Allomuricauda taeanensis]|jgi:gluconokinase|uniref:gluconokinase n=1 Tax=Flagellimonas taeanensis TaxID=1005926 RepID=UPI002E7BA0F5|nr:gluconokinase [Allomuricauda taeanensis]MEE1964034.1 gluconokinase [Allomuricauda taeanensis]
MLKNNKVLVVMGVSGTGKTTVGKLLSEKMGYPFFDGDDYHPEENIKKMKTGSPLDDNDRKGWLIRLNQLALEHKKSGAVIACSALKKNYRGLLRAGLGSNIRFIYLNGSFELIKSRLENRKGHFMPLELLQSQFDTLEPPLKALTYSVEDEPSKIVGEIVKELKQ